MAARGQILSSPKTRKKKIKTVNIIRFSDVIYYFFFHWFLSTFGNFDGSQAISIDSQCGPSKILIGDLCTIRSKNNIEITLDQLIGFMFT